MMSPHTRTGFLYVLFSVVVWSGWVVVSRSAMKGPLTAYDVTALRFGVSGLLFLPVLLRKGIRIGPWGVGGGLLLAALMGAPYNTLAVAGMRFAPASHASTIINGTLLLLTTSVGIFALREPTSGLRLFGIACTLAGIVCILLARSAYNTSEAWLGHLLFIMSGLLWGSYILLVRAWKVEALHAAAVVCVVSAVVYLPLYWRFADSHITLGNLNVVAFQAIYQGVFTAVLALSAFNRGIAILGASRASALVPLVPVLATLLAIPVLHETPSFLEWCGVAVVSLGVLLASGALGRPTFRFRQSLP